METVKSPPFKVESQPDAVARAAFRRAIQAPKVASILDDLAPEAAKELKDKAPLAFRQKATPPRGAVVAMLSCIIIDVLQGRLTREDAVKLLIPKEREYVLAVLDEINEWAVAQGREIDV